MSGTNGSVSPAPTVAGVASAAQRQTDAGAVTVAAGARSVTLMVYAGEPTADIGGAGPVGFPAGSTATWSVDQGGDPGETLDEEFVFTGAAGDDFTVLTTRVA
ncbi:hypothetical protein AB0N20_22615 [Streptomyces griseoincarnatus]